MWSVRHQEVFDHFTCSIGTVCQVKENKMKQMREMSKAIFYNNLMMTIYEIVDAENIDEKSIRIKIIPVNLHLFLCGLIFH